MATSDSYHPKITIFTGGNILYPCPNQCLMALFYPHYRRKFRSQTSDNMDRWKNRGGKSQRGEEKKWENQRGEREGRKKRQVREKVGKSRFTAFFQWIVAPEGGKVGSLKRRVRSHLARWEMKNCALLWREAHFQVKMYKAHQVRTTFWPVPNALP